MKRITVLLLVFLCCVSILFAETKEKGPFGTTWLSSVEELSKAGTISLYEDYGDYATYLFSPQKGHSALDIYMMLILKDVGLVKIAAFGKEIKCSGYGTELKSAYRSMKESLTKSYGTAVEEVDFNSSSLWSDPEDWMFSLSMGHRELYSYWMTDTVFIQLEACADSSTVGYLELTYEHEKWGEYLDSEADVL